MDYQEILTQLLTSGVTACFTMLGGVIVFVFGQIAIKWYLLWFRFGFISEKNKLLEASGDLIAYSNSIRATHHEDWEHIKRRQESIKSLLGFE